MLEDLDRDIKIGVIIISVVSILIGVGMDRLMICLYKHLLVTWK